MPPTRALPTSKDWKTLTLNVRRGLQKPLLDKMVAIDAELDLFGQAFSMMAKRNVAADVRTKAQELRDEWPKIMPGAAVPGVLLRLIEQAGEAVSATGGTTKRSYDDVVCVGYQIRLAEGSQTPKHDWLVAYKGDVDDRTDMISRWTKMCTAIQEAYDAYNKKYPAHVGPGLHPLDRTLRIFMAPEFFFRGRRGAYDDTVAFDILPRLREETNKSRYRNWLFVLGTVIMASFVQDTICPRCRAKLKKDLKRNSFWCNTCNGPGLRTNVGAMIDNIALIPKGGEAGSDNSYWVTKEYVSHVDFTRPVDANGKMPDWTGNRTVCVRGQWLPALPPEGSRDLSARPIGSKYQDERMGGSVFEIDGIRFGVEVCLDHAKNRLTGNENVSIQLVPSCGMKWKAYKCVPNGLYFGVDGATPTCQVGVNGGSPPAHFEMTPCSAGGHILVYDAVKIA